jgi:DNA-binding IclR family transcriptional regulator
VPRPSPQTTRVVQIVELLATRPDGASMTEIARALGVSQASCVHVLAALTTAGFLVREPTDRRYHLGPALVRPGALAAARYPVLTAARPEMAALSDAVGLPCVAFVPEVDHARLAAVTQAPGAEPLAVRLGETVPLTPPLGMVLVAWASEDVFARWLARDPSLDGHEVGRLQADRDAVRALGFVAELAPAPTSQIGLAGVLDDRESPYRDDRLRRLLAGHPGQGHVLTELDDPSEATGVGARSVTAVGAPAFAADGSTCLSLSLVTLPEPLTTVEISRLGAAVAAAADRLTVTLAGLRP